MTTYTHIERQTNYRSPSICPLYKAAVLSRDDLAALLAPLGDDNRDQLELLISCDGWECSWWNSTRCQRNAHTRPTG